MVNLKAKCNVCRVSSEVEVEKADLSTYLGGKLVQSVWPEYTSAQREIIIGSRTSMYLCDDCCG